MQCYISLFLQHNEQGIPISTNAAYGTARFASDGNIYTTTNITTNHNKMRLEMEQNGHCLCSSFI